MNETTTDENAEKSRASLVSVVVTCYNYGRYLSGCLDSVLAQTYRNLEIVLVNDGSTDDTDAVVDPYMSLPNFRYIKQKNAGQANAKNTGIRHCDGDFIAFLDADDRWLPEKIARQIALFRDPEVGVVYCLAGYLDEESRSVQYRMQSEYLQPRRGRVTDWLVYDNFVQFSSTVVRRECLDKFGSFDESLTMGIDWDLWLRISTSYRFDYVPEELFRYRIGHSGQMSKNLAERHRCSDLIMKHFLERYPGAVSEAVVRKAASLSCCNRGEYYRQTDRLRSLGYFLKALSYNVAEMRAYKGLVKNVLFLKK